MLPRSHKDNVRYIYGNHSWMDAWDFMVYVRWGMLILIGIGSLLGF